MMTGPPRPMMAHNPVPMASAGPNLVRPSFPAAPNGIPAKPVTQPVQIAPVNLAPTVNLAQQKSPPQKPSQIPKPVSFLPEKKPENQGQPMFVFKPKNEPKPEEKPASSGFFSSTPARQSDHKFVFKSPHDADVENAKLEEDEKNEEEDVDTGPHFEPVIALPDLIEVKTGEEDEEVKFCSRGKLYRWATSEWKERGLGDIKILKNAVSGKYRVLMRREQVIKNCETLSFASIFNCKNLYMNHSRYNMMHMHFSYKISKKKLF